MLVLVLITGIVTLGLMLFAFQSTYDTRTLMFIVSSNMIRATMAAMARFIYFQLDFTFLLVSFLKLLIAAMVDF